MLQQDVPEHGARGAILNVGSALVDAPEPRHFAMHAYAAAKGAVAAMTRSMAAYYAPHKIRVNAIAPGLVHTPASERSQAAPELAGFIEKKQPLTAGMVDAAEVARAALFLLSGASGPITGAVLPVDGGWSVTGV
jgi:NAD(P)-dependent dehydrogenase (short-subunit alcohol dehydrogenase family)